MNNRRSASHTATQLLHIPALHFWPYRIFHSRIFSRPTGPSMSLTRKHPLAPAYHLLWTSSEDVACQYWPHSSAHSGDSSTQRPTLPSRSSIRSFTWQGLETSSWSSSCSLDRPTPQRHWICSCQPLETGHRTGPWWSHATARAGYAMTMTMTIDVCLLLQVVYKQDLLKQHTQMPIVLVQNLY